MGKRNETEGVVRSPLEILADLPYKSEGQPLTKQEVAKIFRSYLEDDFQSLQSDLRASQEAIVQIIQRESITRRKMMYLSWTVNILFLTVAGLAWAINFISNQIH